MNNPKFRYWDYFNSVMVYSHNFAFLSRFFQQYEKAIEGGNKCELMISIGKLDKTGSLIYERDVLETYLKKNFIKTDLPDVVEVYWFEYGAGFWIKDLCGTDWDYDLSYLDGYEYEVIGNAFENREPLIERS